MAKIKVNSLTKELKAPKRATSKSPVRLVRLLAEALGEINKEKVAPENSCNEKSTISATKTNLN